ncbi:hypothetical protein ACGFX2_24105 [Streptomyces goshikiensis]|uniref:hypothetical protein n=1 Tax=Streptomyces goshikiensis TaxID=1942 RepID=UPI0037126F7B
MLRPIQFQNDATAPPGAVASWARARRRFGSAQRRVRERLRDQGGRVGFGHVPEHLAVRHVDLTGSGHSHPPASLIGDRRAVALPKGS